MTELRWDLKIAAYLASGPEPGLMLLEPQELSLRTLRLIDALDSGLAGRLKEVDLPGLVARVECQLLRDSRMERELQERVIKGEDDLSQPLLGGEFGKLSLPKPREFREILQAQLVKCSQVAASSKDWRKCFLQVWSMWPELLKEQVPDMAFVPASRLIPGYTVWARMEIASALVGALRMAPDLSCADVPALLYVELEGARSFLSAGRSGADLLGAKSVINLLMWSAMRPLIGEFGPDSIVWPEIRNWSQVHKWLASEGVAVPHKAASSDDPGQCFVALVPAMEVSRLKQHVRDSVQSAWRELSQGVRAELEESAGEWRAWSGWAQQIARSFNLKAISLSLDSSPGDQSALPDSLLTVLRAFRELEGYGISADSLGVSSCISLQLLRLLKLSSSLSRCFPAWRGDERPKDELDGVAEEMGPLDPERRGEFWHSLARQVNRRAQTSVMTLSERLSAPALVRRMLGSRVDNADELTWPATELLQEVALAVWRAEVVLRSLPAEFHHFRQRLSSYLALAGEKQPDVMLDDVNWFRQLKGCWFYRESYEESCESEQEALRVQLGACRSALDRLLESFQNGGYGQPPREVELGRIWVGPSAIDTALKARHGFGGIIHPYAAQAYLSKAAWLEPLRVPPGLIALRGSATQAGHWLRNVKQIVQRACEHNQIVFGSPDEVIWIGPWNGSPNIIRVAKEELVGFLKGSGLSVRCSRILHRVGEPYKKSFERLSALGIEIC